VGADGVRVRDLDSKNGSFLRGARIREVTVGAGATLTLGVSELRLSAASSSERLQPSARDHFGGLYGRSLAMRECFALLEQFAASDGAVLIQGETGTGKELCAEAIHGASPRAGGRFVVCDLGAVRPTLIESELFGHRRGAFTGADRAYDGAFRRADGGTLFVDEVGEASPEVQPRLLRAIERGQVKPLGASRYLSSDARVIAATHRDLQAECRAGGFRSDLYHRLAVLRVTLPPLRERKEDIPCLVERLLRSADGADPLSVGEEALALLVEYDWPGNVRELKNVLERARSLAGAARSLTPAHLGLDPIAPAPRRFHEAKEQLISAWEQGYLRALLQRGQGNMTRAAQLAG
jgi:DNA-binding NtrC family response regulator